MRPPPRKEPETGIFRDVWKKLNEVIDYAREIAPVSGRGIKVDRTMNGALFSADIESAPSPSRIQQFRLKEVGTNWLRCRSWNGTTEGATNIYIARALTHRQSVFDGQSISFSSDGDAFTASYVYSSATKRVKTISGVAETQVIIPLYKVDFDVIYASECQQSTGLLDPANAPIVLVDLNTDGRAWAKF